MLKHEGENRSQMEFFCIDEFVPKKHLYGIPSLRRTVEEINMNVAYRWFLGYTMSEKIPHFATISYNFKHRFTEQTIEDVFHWVLDEIAAHHMLSPEAVS